VYAGRDDPRARPAAEAVLSVSRRHGMSHHLADSPRVLGDLDLAAGRYAAVILRLEESVRVRRGRGRPSFLAETLRGLGGAYAAAGDDDAAAEVRTEAGALSERLPDTVAAAEARTPPRPPR
jgi:hypothetical protein